MRKPNDWTRFAPCPVCHAEWRCRKLRRNRRNWDFHYWEGVVTFTRFLEYPHPGRRVRKVKV